MATNFKIFVVIFYLSSIVIPMGGLIDHSGTWLFILNAVIIFYKLYGNNKHIYIYIYIYMRQQGYYPFESDFISISIPILIEI